MKNNHNNNVWCMYIYWCTCMLHAVCIWMEWQSCNIIFSFIRGCPQTLDSFIDLFVCFVHPLTFSFSLSRCFWSSLSNSHTLSFCPVTLKVLLGHCVLHENSESCKRISQNFVLHTCPDLHSNQPIKLNISGIHKMFIWPRFCPSLTSHCHLPWLAPASELVALIESSLPSFTVCLMKT